MRQQRQDGATDAASKSAPRNWVAARASAIVWDKGCDAAHGSAMSTFVLHPEA
jgi:hypothetical protein